MPAPPSRRRVTLAVAAGLLGLVVASAAAAGAGAFDPAPVAGAAAVPTASTSGPTSTPGGDNATLLSRDELFETVVDGDRREHAASLYHVAGNGTWYHADADGSIGRSAPHGDVVPNVAVALENGTTVDETIELPPSARPVYVWKVTQTGCGTTAYDAASGATLAAYPVPSCGLAPPGTVASVATGDPVTAATARSAASPTVDAPTPGFGMPVAVVSILGYLAVARRD